jgi:GNAT superfamily N-acetyltransferase
VELEVRSHSVDDLLSYASVSSTLRVTRILDVTVQSGGLGGITLSERPIDTPYIKDYDRLERPADWAQRFDLSRWAFLGAWADGRRLGGAAVAPGNTNAAPSEDRGDLALLWDIRVASGSQRLGVGSALFAAASAWAIDRGYRHLAVETQNVNVPACRFYARQGCELGAIHRFAYPTLPEEVQMIWYLDLRGGPR